MIKIGFKVFALITVLSFFTLYSILLAMSTQPPSYEVRPEILENVYPPAREHVKGKFTRYFETLMRGENIEVLEINEIEANAYIYNFISEFMGKNGLDFIQNIYLFIKPESLELKFEIPVDVAVQLAKNKFFGRLTLEKSLKKVKIEKGKGSSVSFTIVLKINWIQKEQRPFFYLDKIYIGVMPIPYPKVLNDYQIELNNSFWKSYLWFFRYSPVYLRKVEVLDKVIRLHTEVKMDARTAQIRKVVYFREKNPDIARAIDQHNCLYGCTQKEWDALHSWMDGTKVKSANDISPFEMQFFTSAMSQMKMTKEQLMEKNRKDTEEMRSIMEKRRQMLQEQNPGMQDNLPAILQPGGDQPGAENGQPATPETPSGRPLERDSGQ